MFSFNEDAEKKPKKSISKPKKQSEEPKELEKCPYCEWEGVSVSRHLNYCNELKLKQKEKKDDLKQELLKELKQEFNLTKNKQEEKTNDIELTVPEVIEILITQGKNSQYDDHQIVYKTLTGTTHNANFQARRMKQVLRMIEDLDCLKIVKKN